MTLDRLFSQYQIYLFLGIAALGSWLLVDFFSNKEATEFVTIEHSPDYFSYGYYKKEMTITGVAKNELFADKMIHYSDDGTTHLEKPVMILHSSNLSPWVIKSEKGLVEADKDHLLLSGKVFINRKGNSARKPFNIVTSELKVKLSTNYAETDQWAELSDGLNKTEGVGIEATFVDPVKIKFLSKVKGRYEFN